MPDTDKIPNDNLKANPKEESEGPTRERHCTDVLCFLLLLAFWGFGIFLIYFSFKNGDAALLINTMDYNGNTCGKKGTYTENFPFAYIYQPMQSLSNAVCVSECPSWTQG
jgi:hypothetical protein